MSSNVSKHVDRVLAHNGTIAAKTPTTVTVTTTTQVLSATADTIIMNVGASTAGVASLAAGVEGAEVALLAGTVGASGTIAVTLTGNPSAFDLLTFDAANDMVLLRYIGGAWRVIANIGSVTVA